MLIDEKLKKIKPYLVSLRYEGKTSIIDVHFSDNWMVPESKSIKVKKYAELPNTYMFYSDKEGIVIDDITTYISQVIEYNVEREEKMVLLRVKIEELQEFFVNNDLANLKRMEFNIPKEVTAYKWDDYSAAPYESSENDSDDVIETDFDEVSHTMDDDVDFSEPEDKKG